MKIFRSFIFAVSILGTLFSCQKELKFDDNGVSAGSLLKDGSGSCLPVTINGIYKVDSVLNANNFVDVQVNASTPGTFEIKSDTVNGYSFRKVGSVVFGKNTIRLYASGKPITAGANTFTIKYGTSTCTFTINVASAATGGAVYTIGGSPGSCTGAVVGGTYIAGAALVPSNTLTIQVNVTVLGTYVIGAATTNGFVFSGTGIFISPGLQNVVLTGTGTPLAAGATPVVVANGTSNCSFSIDVLPAGGGSPATFTLSGSPATCTGATANGTYTVGIAAAVTNTITLNVDVTVAGTYTISTVANNGLIFSKTGVFTTTGPQTVILAATGTPVAAGAFNFTASGGGTNSCIFSVNCAAAPPPPPGDYFPLTANSWWSYDVSFGGVTSPDSVLYLSTNMRTFNGNPYRDFEVSQGGFPTDTLEYRKSGNDYYNWAVTDSYSGVFQFDNTAYGDILFLKENAATGTTWSSAVFSGTTANGTVPAFLRYDFKIENANTSFVVRGITYTNVIHVSCTSKVSITGAAGPYTTLDVNNMYFAKGIGLIKVKDIDPSSGTSIAEFDLRYYHVF